MLHLVVRGAATRTTAAATSARATTSAVVAGPSATTFGCQPVFGTLGPEGSLDQRITVHENVTAEPWTDPIAAHTGVSTMSSTAHTYSQSTRRHYFRTLAIRGGRLVHFMTSHTNDDPSSRTTTTRVYGPGWGAFTRLVDASDRGTAVTKSGFLYALNPTTGVLARYSVTEGRSFGDLGFRSAGTSAGWRHFSALTLLHRYRAGYAGAADVLYATTRAGALYQVTIPNTAAFTPRLTLVRSSTWTFDQLAVDRCDDKVALLGVRTGSDQAFLHRVDSFAGATSVIRGFGRVGSTWDAAHTSGAWDADMGPSRW